MFYIFHDSQYSGLPFNEQVSFMSKRSKGIRHGPRRLHDETNRTCPLSRRPDTKRNSSNNLFCRNATTMLLHCVSSPLCSQRNIPYPCSGRSRFVIILTNCCQRCQDLYHIHSRSFPTVYLLSSAQTHDTHYEVRRLRVHDAAG